MTKREVARIYLQISTMQIRQLEIPGNTY